MKPLPAVLLLLALTPATVVRGQTPGDKPQAVAANARRERQLRASIAEGTATQNVYLELAGLLDSQQRIADAVQVLRAAAALEPLSAAGQHRIGMFFWQKVATGTALDAATTQSYIRQGIDAEDRALALQPDDWSPMFYKSMLLRHQARTSPDPLERKRLVNEAAVLEVQHLRQAQSAARGPGAAAVLFPEPFDKTQERLRPVKVGGDVEAPVKTNEVVPTYPPIAQSARIQGSVTLQVIVDEAGKVANASILRSVPLLDAAALDAVSKWQYLPTNLDGHPVAVTMMVTVNFLMK